MVKIGQKMVNVVFECPLRTMNLVFDHEYCSRCPRNYFNAGTEQSFLKQLNTVKYCQILLNTTNFHILNAKYYMQLDIHTTKIRINGMVTT